MKFNKSVVLAACMLAIVPAATKLVPPALADQAAQAASDLIDKDFQNALRKHLERRFFDRINATDEQRDKIDAVIVSTMDETYPMREKLREGLVELNDMAAKDDTTDDQILQKAHELRALHEQIADKGLDAMLKVRHTLTPDQRKDVAGRVHDLLTGGWKGRHRLQGSD